MLAPARSASSGSSGKSSKSAAVTDMPSASHQLAISLALARAASEGCTMSNADFIIFRLLHRCCTADATVERAKAAYLAEAAFSGRTSC